MKFNLLFFVFSFICFSMSSCDRNMEDNINTDANAIEPRVAPSDPIKLKCTGTCPERACKFHYDSKFPNKQSCYPCSDCIVSYSPTDGVGFGDIVTDLSDVLSSLSNILLNKYNTPDYSIDSILVMGDSSKEFIQIFYFIEGIIDSSQSIAFLVDIEINTNGEKMSGGKVVIDCSGNCKPKSGGCVAEWMIEEKKVRCSCESDNCKMTVTTLD